MIEYKREYPLFSLCGLNCGLCPRYQSKGESRCPGCGGKDFFLKHPACAVITCNRKHDRVEYCFQCAVFPCDRFARPSAKDSFITYQRVLADLEKARSGGIESYRQELNEKVEILEYLIDNFNDGRKTGFFCLAVNLLSLEDLQAIMEDVRNRLGGLDIPQKEKLDWIVSSLKGRADSRGVDLRLRK